MYFNFEASMYFNFEASIEDIVQFGTLGGTYRSAVQQIFMSSKDPSCFELGSIY